MSDLPRDENTSENEAESAAPDGAEDPIAKLEQSNRELNDRLLRLAAEFENYKKRTKKETDDAANRGRESLLKELLPVLDNFERALAHASKDDPLAIGVRMVEKQMISALEKFSVTRFDALGKPFDPALHEAVQQAETVEFSPGTVAQEFSKGYLIGGRLLRPAIVAVAKAPSAPAEPN